MPSLDALAAAHLADLLRAIEAALAAARDEIDALNVFPVPDGDTGTNLLLTVRSALDAVEASAPDEVCTAAGRGAIRGARGNSGVIFSQVVRALTEALSRSAADARAAAGFFEHARALAYEAVAHPLEGTMLTAMAAAAVGAAGAGPDATLEQVLAAALAATSEAVAGTREMLEENRLAGVVDAGARGFEVVLGAAHAFVAGVAAPEAAPPPVRRTHGPVVRRESGSLDFAFEVQYLLEAPDDVAVALRKQLDEVGDSVVVVACGGLLNVHVHTNDIGLAIELGLGHGRPSRIEVTAFADQITAFREQHPELGIVPPREAGGAAGVVAVLPRGPLHELAHGCGATVVAGEAGRLPAVADLLDAIVAARAPEVAVLPGHRNAVPTARQAALEAPPEVAVTVVAAAESVPAVLAALACFDPTAAAFEVLAEAAGGVRAGEVVSAVRDADTPVGRVRRGQLLGVVAGAVAVADDDAVAVLVDVVRRLLDDAAEIVTLVVGADVGEEEREVAVAAVRRQAGGCDVDVIDGGQRPARYLVGVE